MLGAAAGLAVTTLPAMTWGTMSGMEVTLVSALVLGGFYVYLVGDPIPRRRLVGILLLCLACLARPEVLVILALVASHHLWQTRPFAGALRQAAWVLVIAVAVLGPFVLLAYFTTGHPLPTTFYAKSGPGLVRALSEANSGQVRRLLLVHGPNAVWKLGATLLEQLGTAGAVLLACGCAGVMIEWRRQRGAILMLACILASAFAMGLAAPQRLKPENFRYTTQLLSLVVVAGFCGLSVLSRLSMPRLVRLAVPAALVVCTFYQSVAAAPIYARSVKNIQELHVTLAEWMERHLPPESTVAVNDIGALAFFSGRRIVDLEGLVSPAALAYPRQERGISFVRATRPDYIAIFPEWYPDIIARPDLFREVYRVSIDDNFVSAGSVLVVFSTPWTRFPPVPSALTSPRGHRWPA